MSWLMRMVLVCWIYQAPNPNEPNDTILYLGLLNSFVNNIKHPLNSFCWGFPFACFWTPFARISLLLGMWNFWGLTILFSLDDNVKHIGVRGMIDLWILIQMWDPLVFIFYFLSLILVSNMLGIWVTIKVIFYFGCSPRQHFSSIINR